MEKRRARSFGTLLIGAIIIAAIAIPSVSAIPEDTMKLNFEKWFLKDNTISNFPKWDDSAAKSTKDITTCLAWSTDSESLTGAVPFAVRFCAASTGGTWDFGDECHSAEQYHIHSYKKTGTYTATYFPEVGEPETISITVVDSLPEGQQKEIVTKEATQNGFFGLF